MAFMDWSEGMSVGIFSIDAQHKKLVEMINTLHSALRQGKSAEVAGRIVTQMKAYAFSHFAHEEKCMIQTAYPGLAGHKKEHAAFVQQVEDVTSGKVEMTSIELIEFLRKWLVQHIQGTDKKYGPHLKTKGVK
jgi:hemerythrin